MISVVIATNNDERSLGQCLAALVSAAIDGLVREVILADAGSTDDTLEIAEDAGARVVQGDIAAACAVARANWLLIVDVAVPAPPGWDEAAATHINVRSDQAAWWGSAPLLGRKIVRGLLVSRQTFEAEGYLGAVARAKRLKL